MSTRCHCRVLFQTINNCYAFIYMYVDSKDPSRFTSLSTNLQSSSVTESSSWCPAVCAAGRSPPRTGRWFSRTRSVFLQQQLLVSRRWSLSDTGPQTWRPTQTQLNNQTNHRRCPLKLTLLAPVLFTVNASPSLCVCPSASCAVTFYRVARLSWIISAAGDR